MKGWCGLKCWKIEKLLTIWSSTWQHGLNEIINKNSTDLIILDKFIVFNSNKGSLSWANSKLTECLLQQRPKNFPLLDEIHSLKVQYSLTALFDCYPKRQDHLAWKPSRSVFNYNVEHDWEEVVFFKHSTSKIRPSA